MTKVAVYYFLASNDSLKPIIHLLTLVTCGFCFVCVRSILTAISIVFCRGLVLLLCETTDNTLPETRKDSSQHHMFVGCYTLYVPVVYCCYIVYVFWGGGGLVFTCIQ